MTAPIELVDTAVAAVQTQAAELGLSWHLHQATVLDGATPSLVKLRMDGDTLASAVTFATSMVGALVVGARVFVLEVPPAGLYVVGWVGVPAAVGAAFAYKTADETVNNSSTLQDDDELFVEVAANAVYKLSLLAAQNSGATPGFKLNFTLPAGASWLLGSFDCGSSAATEQFGITTGSVTGITGVGADSLVIIDALISTANAGTVVFQWAQNLADASNTVVRAGSSLTLTRMR